MGGEGYAHAARRGAPAPDRRPRGEGTAGSPRLPGGGERDPCADRGGAQEAGEDQGAQDRGPEEGRRPREVLGRARPQKDLHLSSQDGDWGVCCSTHEDLHLSSHHEDRGVLLPCTGTHPYKGGVPKAGHLSSADFWEGRRGCRCAVLSLLLHYVCGCVVGCEMMPSKGAPP